MRATLAITELIGGQIVLYASSMPPALPLEPVVHAARGNPLTGLAASPWAPLVALAGQKQILLYHGDTLELLGILPFGEGQPCDVKFSRNGKLLLANGGHAAKSGRVLVWDVTTGERLATVGEEYDAVLAADLSPDQARVALGGPGRLVKIYSTQTGELLHKMKKHTDWVTALAFSPNGEMLASADRNGGVSVWDPDNGQEMHTLAGHKAAVTAVSWRDDSKFVASCGEDGAVKIWETQEGKQARTWNAHGPGALSVSYAHDGRLVTCGRDHAITLWSAEGNKVRACESSGELPLRAAFSHDGGRVFATDFAGHLAAWDAATGKRVGELDANPPPLAEQLAVVEKKLGELQQAGGGKPSGEFAGAEAAATQIAQELEQAAAALEKARAAQTAKETAYAEFKQQAAQTPTPALTNKMTAARAERTRARVAFTNATELVQTKTREAAAAQAKFEQARKENDPVLALARARETLARLQAAQAVTVVFRARESLAAKKREHEQLAALAAEKQEAMKKAEQELAAAAESSAKSKLKAALKTAAAEARSAEASLKKSAAELADEEKRAGKLPARL